MGGAFKKLGILTLTCQYILLVVLMTNNNYIINVDNFHTRNKKSPMQNKAKKSISQKRVHYNGINIFNKLPNNNKQLKDIKIKFRME